MPPPERRSGHPLPQPRRMAPKLPMLGEPASCSISVRTADGKRWKPGISPPGKMGKPPCPSRPGNPACMPFPQPWRTGTATRRKNPSSSFPTARANRILLKSILFPSIRTKRNTLREIRPGCSSPLIIRTPASGPSCATPGKTNPAVWFPWTGRQPLWNAA